MALTPEQEIEKAIGEFDIPQIYADYLVLEQKKFWHRLLSLFSDNVRKFDQLVADQLEFLAEVHSHLKFEPIMEQPYIMLGALKKSEEKWGKFEDDGPLRDLEFREDDLIQVISENDPSVNLQLLFEHPNLIVERAEEKFATFIKKHQPIEDYLYQP